MSLCQQADLEEDAVERDWMNQRWAASMLAGICFAATAALVGLNGIETMQSPLWALGVIFSFVAGMKFLFEAIPKRSAPTKPRWVEAGLTITGVASIGTMMVVWMSRGDGSLPSDLLGALPFVMPYPFMFLVIRSRWLFMLTWIAVTIWIVNLFIGIVTSPSSTAAIGFLPLLFGSYALVIAASILQFTIYVFKNSKDLFARETRPRAE